MLFMNDTDIGNDWGAVIDSVIKEKPKFIKRTHDYMFMSNLNILESILEPYKFTAEKLIEPDGSVTLGLEEIDLAVNGKDEEEAVRKMAEDILEYAEDYYSDFDNWYSAVNRKSHLPYVVKALMLNDVHKIGRLIVCHLGEI